MMISSSQLPKTFAPTILRVAGTLDQEVYANKVVLALGFRPKGDLLPMEKLIDWKVEHFMVASCYEFENLLVYAPEDILWWEAYIEIITSDEQTTEVLLWDFERKVWMTRDTPMFWIKLCCYLVTHCANSLNRDVDLKVSFRLTDKAVTIAKEICYDSEGLLENSASALVFISEILTKCDLSQVIMNGRHLSSQQGWKYFAYQLMGLPET